jgi:starch-binding outer membrane protein, SusD/RagB family
VIQDLEFAETNLAVGAAGKANKAAAQALLAKAYLNKAVYTAANVGGPFTFAKADMDKVIEYCNKIGNKSLAPAGQYFNNFHWDNTVLSPEIIFAIENVEGAVRGNTQNRYMMSLHYNQTPSGWNGFTTLADFYKSFESGDERLGGSYPGMTDKIGLKTGFLVGQQKGPGGVDLTDRSGNPLKFTENANLLYAQEADGILSQTQPIPVITIRPEMIIYSCVMPMFYS